ncbi:DNA-3-methyladenine glycosylase II [Bacillus subtilis]|nr:DNA-3-methyladenine glycosylase II [Bacillus subtilis]KIN38803.1 DNA-3-methyladenine glycosylase II [Bacillus subtilis]KIN50291.1 DNA-3-methyladenine glycosylase II [Bacillus subtilis]
MWKEKVSVTPPYHFDRVLDRLSLDPPVCQSEIKRGTYVL